MTYDNPVRRLHTLLTRAFEIASQKNNQKISTNKIWAEVFEISPNDNEALIRCADEFFVLMKESIEATKLLQTVGYEPYIRALDRVRTRLYSKSFLHSQWGSFASGLNDETLIDRLEMTADAIDRESRLVQLSQDQLNELLTNAKALLEEIRQSALDDDIKNFLFIRLEEVCSAIQHYSISGSAGLKRVIEANIGSTFLKLHGLTPEEKKTPLFEKFLKLMLQCGGWLGLFADVDGFLLPKVTETLLQIPPGS